MSVARHACNLDFLVADHCHERSKGEPHGEGKEEREPSEVEGAHVRTSAGEELDLRGLAFLVDLDA